MISFVFGENGLGENSPKIDNQVVKRTKVKEK